MTYAYISRVETGNRLPSIHVLRKLARELGVSVHWLETGEISPAEELAALVLEHEDRLPPNAKKLAQLVLEATY